MDEINKRAKRALIIDMCLALIILLFFGIEGFITAIILLVSVDLILSIIAAILDCK